MRADNKQRALIAAGVIVTAAGLVALTYTAQIGRLNKIAPFVQTLAGLAIVTLTFSLASSTRRYAERTDEMVSVMREQMAATAAREREGAAAALLDATMSVDEALAERHDLIPGQVSFSGGGRHDPEGLESLEASLVSILPVPVGCHRTFGSHRRLRPTDVQRRLASAAG